MIGKMLKKIPLLLIMVITALSPYPLARSSKINLLEAAQSSTPKYIFFFLADGTGLSHLEITRRYSRLIHGEGFTITDKIMREGVTGLITTHNADSLVTDSAAAATALALGCKAHRGVIGICADGSKPKPVLLVAMEKGMRVGIATNTTVYDASPAAFLCHVRRRKSYGDIVSQYFTLEPDLLMGGGRDVIQTNALPIFLEKGYEYVSNVKGLSEAKGPKVLGLFAPGDMNYEIDRDKSQQPSIYDMTQTIIRILEKDLRKGFMVFIESEHSDGASHRNDVTSVIHELREFDRAVALAYQFYKRHPHETLLLVTSDHETGGLSVTTTLKERADRYRNGKRVIPGIENIRKIQSISISIKKALEVLGRNPSPDALDSLLTNHFKGFSLTPELRAAILNNSNNAIEKRLHSRVISSSLGQMVAHSTLIYWTSQEHTAQPVFIAALGVGAERFGGYQDNTDIARHLFGLLGEKVSQR